MRVDKDKKIGSATYLNKSNETYIPFEVRMDGTNCELILPMLYKTNQTICYKDKDYKD